jgi:2-keto-3-deoxy-L-rhamnonate aldolase RhmA
MDFLENSTKEKLARGQVTYGVVVGWPSSELVQFLSIAGYDWLFIDTEHSLISQSDFAEMVRVCHLTSVTPFVRVAENTPGTILRHLEAGALGIIAPHLNTADDAKRLVDAVRYPPKGHRGAGGNSWVNDFSLTTPEMEYFARANEQILTWGIVEEDRGIKNLDEILSVEGLDIVGVGPSDLGLSMGLSKMDPQVKKLVEDAEKKIVASGKTLMTLVFSPEHNAAAVGRGARMIVSGWAPVAVNALKSALRELKAMEPVAARR